MSVSKRKKNTLEINYTFSDDELISLIIYSLTEDNLITINCLKKLNKLITHLNLDNYDDDTSLSKIFVLSTAVKYRLKGINDSNTIITACRDSKYWEEIDDIIDEINDKLSEFDDERLDDKMILYLDQLISDILRYSFIYQSAEKLASVTERLTGKDYTSLHGICEEYEHIVERIYSKFKEVKQLSEDANTDFNSNDTSCVNALKNTLNQLQSPTNILRSSVRMKNEMLNGGYEAGRFYLVLGLQGRGKSRELLQIAMDFKHYNKEAVIIDGKKAVILFITQENSIKDTLGRIWSFYTNDETDFKNNKSAEDAYEILSKHGFNSGIELSIKYRKSRSITTADIDIMIDEIEQDGTKKVIAVIHDYLKRIRSAESVTAGDTYTELGEVSDEFCSIAKARNIVVVSAMQFNRTAMKEIQEAMRKNKSDPLKLAGSSYISESIKIIDNADVVYSLLDINDNTSTEMKQSYNLLKFRGKRNNSKDKVDYFIHPFVEGSTIRLAPDLHLAKSLSKLQSGDGLANLDVKAVRAKRASNGGRLIKSSDDVKSNKEKLDKLIEGTD